VPDFPLLPSLALAAALLLPAASANAVPPAPKTVTAFQSANMPDTDRKTLSPQFLKDNAARAYAAWKNAPWAAQVPRAVFLNDILPYASLTEPREDWRPRLAAVAGPLVAGCKTPGEAAMALNKGLFPAVKVRYSTARSRADQSPAETMSSGIASCSGLSILLVDACRSVGVPARVVGTPLWADGRGNHTWVEVWDDGGWHYLGAAEPDDKGLDHAWFAGDAARAVKDSPEHAIYASSFRRTGLSFPLVWAPETQWVSAENVTDRYATPAAAALADPDHVSVHIRVTDAAGKRVVVPVMVRDLDDTTGNQSGVSTGDTADHNNLLKLNLRRGRAYEIIAGKEGHQARQTFASGTEAMDTVTLTLPPVLRPAAPLAPASAKALNTALAAYFAAPAAMQATWKFPPKLDALLLQNEGAVRQAAWEAYKAAPIHQAAREDMAASQVRSGEYLSPYIVKTVGTRPPGGWGLVIAMHGGGGAPKELNDSQWHGMATYYNDHPEAGGYKYLALRAPNDTWNGFYDDYVYPLVTRLINEYLVLGDVNPDKIYLIGYSHGGYGAFAIGPKMPDRFASIHASAGAGTDGESAVENLRDVPFSVWVGEFDTMYGRLDRTKALATKLAGMRDGHPDTYPMSVDIKTGFQHGNLPDHDELAVMLPAVRNPVPCVVTWLMTDTVIHDFYWLHSDRPSKTQRLDASIENNAVVVTASPNVAGASVLLDSRLVDFARPVTVSVNGKLTTLSVIPHLKTLAETLARRGDPRLAFTAALPITAP